MAGELDSDGGEDFRGKSEEMHVRRVFGGEEERQGGMDTYSGRVMMISLGSS